MVRRLAGDDDWPEVVCAGGESPGSGDLAPWCGSVLEKWLMSSRRFKLGREGVVVRSHVHRWVEDHLSVVGMLPRCSRALGSW